MDGIVVVDKPQDFTSFDVCAKLRGIFETRKIGHAGTLDPMATGVLPVFIGSATKACDVLPNDKKAYTAQFKLGIKTNTQDIWGEVLKSEESYITEDELVMAADTFLGDIKQLPPMYSAVKVNGQKLYKLARQGIEIERDEREAHIYTLDILSFDEDSQSGEMYVVCSKGTYIRTLICDIAELLGTCGVMTGLRRNESSGFSLENAITIDRLQTLKDSGKLDSAVIATDKAFLCYESVKLDKKRTWLYKNGVALRADQISKKSGTFRVYGNDKEFLGLLSNDTNENTTRRIKNFY